MNTLRSSLAKWAIPAVGLYLIVISLVRIFGVPVSPVVLGVIGLFAGLCCLCAS